jgi:hypothetical protein
MIIESESEDEDADLDQYVSDSDDAGRNSDSEDSSSDVGVRNSDSDVDGGANNIQPVIGPAKGLPPIEQIDPLTIATMQWEDIDNISQDILFEVANREGVFHDRWLLQVKLANVERRPINSL